MDNYYGKHKTEIIERSKAYAKKNPEKVKAYKQKSYRKNLENIRQVYKLRNETPEGKARLLLHDAKHRSFKIDTTLELTLEDIVEKLQVGCCTITKIPFDFSREVARNPWTPSLDRVDSKEPYTKDNTQIVCWAYNNLKSDLNPHELEFLLKRILKIPTDQCYSDILSLERWSSKLQERKYRQKLTARLAKAKERSLAKGLDYNLDFEWLLEKVTLGNCEATQLPFLVGLPGSQNPWGPSPDRIDSKKGYTKDNIQVVCWAFNRAKGELNKQEFDMVTLSAAKGHGLL